MLSYVAYGLSIHSVLPLPELVAREGPGDVVIRWGDGNRLPLETSAEGQAGSYFRATARETYLFWEDMGAFSVRDGREIVIDPAPGVEERELRLVILGAALGALLRQRGYLVLHASAVAIAGGVIAFLGMHGAGKSTTAAALHTRGHRVVADDVTAIEVGTDRSLVVPGFPQLKLWPEAATALGEDMQTLHLLHPRLKKRARRVVDGFVSTPLPLRFIYVLAEGETQNIKPLRPQEALVELVRHSNGSQLYGSQLIQSVGASSHFFQCARVVNNVRIRSLSRPRSLPALSDLARLVEEDVQSLGHGPDGRHSP
jgi:hypothetical protein